MSDDPSLLNQYWLLRNACVDPKLSSASKAVLAVILEHRNRAAGTAYPGFDRIARMAGVHRTSVMRAVAELEATGYLAVARQERRANRYSFPSWPATGDWPGLSGSAGATRMPSTRTSQTLQNRRVPSRRLSAVERVKANVEAAERRRLSGSAGTTSYEAVADASGSASAQQLVAPAHPSGSTAAQQLVAPMRPEPASNYLEPTGEHTERAYKLENQRAWINQRLRLGDITKEEAAEELRTLC